MSGKKAEREKLIKHVMIKPLPIRPRDDDHSPEAEEARRHMDEEKKRKQKK